MSFSGRRKALIENLELFKVRITKDNGWHTGRIGQIFEVYKSGYVYMVINPPKEDPTIVGCWIFPGDCVVLRHIMRGIRIVRSL